MELRYLHGGMVTYPPGATFGPRLLNDYELVWLVQGQAIYHCNGTDHEVPAGSIVLAQPGFHESYTWDRTRPTRHVFVHLGIDRLPEDWPDPTTWPVVRHLPEHDIVRPLFRHLIESLRVAQSPHVPVVPTPMQRRAAEVLLGAMLVGPVGLAHEHERDMPEPIQTAMTFMRSRLEEKPDAPLQLRELAKAASVSPEHLCRLFRAQMGTGPMETLRLLRLDMAVSLLARSNLTLAQIAQRCGFASPYHFSRKFREAYGQPPSVVRKNIAQGVPPPTSRLMRGGQ